MLLVKTGNCKYDSDCAESEACIERLCQNPCLVPFDPCGAHAECQTKIHRPVCQCAAGFVGNPHTECYQCRFAVQMSRCALRQAFPHPMFSTFVLDECLKDDDCPFTKSCVNKECTDPCHQTACGKQAVCLVEYHRAHCSCPAGLQGNPLVSCEQVGCRTDDDCQQQQRCDYSSRNCVPLCTGSSCALGATCQAQSHKESCKCNPPLQGDGYSFCEKRKNEQACCFQNGWCLKILFIL